MKTSSISIVIDITHQLEFLRPMKNVEIGTALADSLGFTEENWGHQTILQKEDDNIFLNEFRWPKKSTSIEELKKNCHKLGYAFFY